MKILLTGAFGNVGKSTLKELVKRNYDVRVFDIKSKNNEKYAKKYKDRAEIFWGDLRNYEDVKNAMNDIDRVIHVAAIIPPLADHQPDFAREVNVGGTENIIKAMESQPTKPKLIYTSSISVYGDRRKNPHIKVSDPVKPTDHDEYAKQKLEAEGLVRKSSLESVIFRLTYIVSPEKLQMDPLMFHMPLETCIEICHTKDVGLALVNAIEFDNAWGETLNLAGGPSCRIVYRNYIDKMIEIFGLGTNLLPAEAFSCDDFHCGFMDTKKTEELLKFQHHDLDYYFNQVKKKVEISRIFLRFFTLITRPIAKRVLLSKSPYYQEKSRV